MQDASEGEIKCERTAEVLILQGDMIRRAFADFGEAGARLEQSLWSVLAKDIALRELVVHHPYSDRGQARSEPARTSRPHLGRASATPLAHTSPAPRPHLARTRSRSFRRRSCASTWSAPSCMCTRSPSTLLTCHPHHLLPTTTTTIITTSCTTHLLHDLLQVRRAVPAVPAHHGRVPGAGAPPP